MARGQKRPEFRTFAAEMHDDRDTTGSVGDNGDSRLHNRYASWTTSCMVHSYMVHENSDIIRRTAQAGISLLARYHRNLPCDACALSIDWHCKSTAEAETVQLVLYTQLFVLLSTHSHILDVRFSFFSLESSTSEIREPPPHLVPQEHHSMIHLCHLRFIASHNDSVK